MIIIMYDYYHYFHHCWTFIHPTRDSLNKLLVAVDTPFLIHPHPEHPIKELVQPVDIVVLVVVLIVWW